MNSISINEKIQTIIGDFGILLPEGIIVLGSIVLLLSQLIWKEEGARWKTLKSLLFLGIAAWSVNQAQTGLYFDGLFVISDLTIFVKYLFLLILGVVLLFPKGEKLLEKGEYHFLLFMILFGGFLLIQVQNLLLFYLALELISITSYVLITFTFDKKGFEAGIKYLLFGAMASGLMLYGISLLYGLSGSLNIADIASLLGSGVELGLWFQLASLLFFVGVLFKLAMVPLHIWTPDVYEAGPTPVVAYISVLPKIAVLIFLVGFVQTSDLNLAIFNWKLILSTLAVLSMFIGNLSALAQDNAKRMMAYSSIAHSGMLIVGVIVGTDFGLQAMLFYAMVYAAMNLSAFYFIDLMNKNDINKSSEMAGLGRKHPLIGVLITLVMIALIGLPPTGGFTAKLLVFTSLWEYYTTNGDSYLLWLFIAGLINAAISLFYYLKIPYYLLIVSTDTKKRLIVSKKDGTILVILVFVILLSFFKADLLLNLINQFNFAL